MTWRSFVVISKFGGHVHTELGNSLSPSRSPQFPPLFTSTSTPGGRTTSKTTQDGGMGPLPPSFTVISALGGGTTLVPLILTQRGEVVSKRGQMTQQGDSGVGEWKGKWHGKGHGRDDEDWPPGPNFNKRDKVSLFLPPPICTRCVPPFFKCLLFY